jgi:hypothetical protein
VSRTTTLAEQWSVAVGPWNLDADSGGIVTHTVHPGPISQLPSAIGAHKLSPEHATALATTGLSADVVAARGYWTADAANHDELRSLGHSPSIILHGPALMLPVHDVYGGSPFTMARPNIPRLDSRGRPRKYETPRGVHLRLDVPPTVRSALRDPEVRLWVTEGQKKADTIVAAGANCALALLGVWAWKGHALPDWESVTLRDRTVYLAFDSDSATNPKVTQALRRLRAFLMARGSHVRIVPLEPQPDGSKVGIDDALMGGATLDQLAAASTAHMRSALAREDRRPDLDVGSLDLSVSVAAFGHLARAGIFRSGGALVRVATEDGTSVVRQLPTVDLRALLHRVVRCVRLSKAQGMIPCQPPRDLAEDLAHAPDPPVPHLRRVATGPTFAGDGRLLERAGYDATSGILVTLNWAPKPVPATITIEDVREARRLWDAEAFVDFPFASHADHTAAMALALTPLARDLIEGPTPAFGVEASIRGSGKGKLVTAALTPSMGPRGWTVATLPPEDDELRKAITAYLAEGRAGVLFDNITHPVRSGVLAKALTDMIWDDRLLGHSASVRLPVRCTWVLTGNNPSYSEEIGRRVVPVRLVPQTDRPEARRNFHHQELESWVGEHRADLLWGLAVFVRAWQAAARPLPSCPVLGSYEAWTRVVGGILQVAGYAGFLANREGLLAASDPETANWKAFLAAWWEQHGSRLISISDMVPMAKANGVRVGGNTDFAQATSLGLALGSRRDRFFGPYQVQQGTGRARRQWFLQEAVTPGATYDTSPLDNPGMRRARAEESAGIDVSQVARGVTDHPERSVEVAWELVDTAERTMERDAIQSEGGE